jgi:predicted tellurium resistance membrane protein TerC
VVRFLGDKFPDVTPRKSRNFDRKQPASLLLLIEALLIAVLGFYMVALGFTHDKSWIPYLSVIGFAFVGSAALFLLFKGVKEGKRWANSPAILANLIALGVAKYQFEAGLYWLAIPISAMAATIVISIFLNIKNSNK